MEDDQKKSKWKTTKKIQNGRRPKKTEDDKKFKIKDDKKNHKWNTTKKDSKQKKIINNNKDNKKRKKEKQYNLITR